jgi:hypothetical protein
LKSYSFIDRYFHSEKELVDIRGIEGRDINTLFTYLNNLHSLSDKLKDNFNVSISRYPEFKVLRILRNYFHHVDDIDEIRFYVNIKDNMTSYHVEQLVIPLNVWAKAVNNFKIQNTVPESRQDFKKKQDFIAKEFDKILDICDCVELLESPESYCRSLKLNCDGKVYDLGFDMFKYVYNITNIIADVLREIDVVSNKAVVLGLDKTYSRDNCIPKFDISGHASNNMLLTTEGYIYPDNVAAAI